MRLNRESEKYFDGGGKISDGLHRWQKGKAMLFHVIMSQFFFPLAKHVENVVIALR